MKNYEELLSTDTYWLSTIQIDLFNAINAYMEQEGLNRTELAKRLGVSKGYITQIMNGDFDYRLSTFVKLLLATGNIPNLKIEPLVDYIGRQNVMNAIKTETTEKIHIPVQTDNTAINLIPVFMENTTPGLKIMEQNFSL